MNGNSANLTYWAFSTWASISVWRESMLMALLTLQQPEISVSKMRKRIGHGHPSSVNLGFEPFESCGIVSKMSEVKNQGFYSYPTYSVDFDMLKETIRTWEEIDLNHESAMSNYITKSLELSLIKNEPNGVYVERIEDIVPDDFNSWSVKSTINRSTGLAMKILFIKEKCGFEFNNWIEFLSRIIPTKERVTEICELGIEKDGAGAGEWDTVQWEGIRDTYSYIDLNAGFRLNVNNWMDINGWDNGKGDLIATVENIDYGRVLGIPYVNNNEIISDGGEGEIIRL